MLAWAVPPGPPHATKPPHLAAGETEAVLRLPPAAARKQSHQDVLIQLAVIYFMLVSASPPGDLQFHWDLRSPLGDPGSTNLSPPAARRRLSIPMSTQGMQTGTCIAFYQGEPSLHPIRKGSSGI